ncbi:uncharacterized protein TNCV_2779321 [Trichonephila clavipes]|nr:uncharacterized protein TNCV_2779321 [Trichonephila clavipes]
MVREDTGARSEGTACVWTAANEADGCTRACVMILWSSGRLVCQGHPEPGHCVNDISSVHGSQHLLPVKSKRPTGRATRRADHQASIIRIDFSSLDL